jgi:fructoselysine-6-P-deglycase FrlB-like protein
MSQRAAARHTTLQEIQAQLPVITAALETAAPLAERLVRTWGHRPRWTSVGIGDSHLVGLLGQSLRPEGLEFDAWRSTELWRGTWDHRLVLVQSIGGDTPVSVAAARTLQAEGRAVVGITGERTSLFRLLEDTFLLDIPRYPPDAKVPGTLTVSVPLALLQLLQDLSMGRSSRASMDGLLTGVASALQRARETFSDQWANLPAVLPDAVYIVTTPELESAGAYLQSKLIEGLGIPAAAFDPETWLHVAKHGVHERTLTVVLGTEGAAQHPLETVRIETRRRGGHVVDAGPPGGHWPLEGYGIRPQLWHALFFSQYLLLALLSLDDLWAPFQTHRLTREEIRDLRQTSVVTASGLASGGTL